MFIQFINILIFQDFVIKYLPKILDRIEIRALRRLLHHFDTLLFEELSLIGFAVWHGALSCIQIVGLIRYMLGVEGDHVTEVAPTNQLIQTIKLPHPSSKHLNAFSVQSITCIYDKISQKYIILQQLQQYWSEAITFPVIPLLSWQDIWKTW